MVAEGTHGSVSQLIQSMTKALARNITRHEVVWSVATGKFKGFEIRPTA